MNQLSPLWSVVAGFVSPLAAWQAMALLAMFEPRVREVLDDPKARGVINLYFQFATTFEERRATLLMERTQLDEERDRGPHEPASLAQSILAYLGLGNTALSLHDTWLPAERREFLLTVTSDRRASARNVHFTLAEPFRTIANRAAVTSGGPVRDRGRTWQQLIRYLWDWCIQHPILPLRIGPDPLNRDMAGSELSKVEPAA